MKTILQLCADTGSDSKPWKDNGYNIISESDMEFRSLCSQKFAQAFFEVNT